MQSPAPAKSLAEPPPAASPQLGRGVCQQGLRSARIRGLLLVLAAASAAASSAAAASAAAASAAAAAAAASTTTTLVFLRLVVFRTGKIHTGYPICTYTSCMGSYTVICRLHCCTLRCSKSVWPGFNSGLEWMTIYLLNTYGFIRHGDSRSNKLDDSSLL